MTSHTSKRPATLIMLSTLLIVQVLSTSCGATAPEPVLPPAESPISPLSPSPTAPNNGLLPATSTPVLLLPTSTSLTTPIQITPSTEEESPIGKPKGKLSFRLQLLADPAVSQQDAEAQAQILSLPASGPGSLLRNEQGELLVYIRLTDTSEVNLVALTEVGATVTHVAEAYRTVTAYISATQLSVLAKVNIVESVQEALSP